MPKLLHFLICYVISISAISWAQYYSHGDRHMNCRKRYTITWNPCLYECHTGTRLYLLKYPDGTHCIVSSKPLILGRCIQGHCRKDAVRPTRPSLCNPPQKVVGYVPGCQYRCPGNTGKMGAYPYGTPCIQLSGIGKLQGRAGICKNGDCIAHDLLDGREAAQQVAGVFAENYRKCPDKEHLGKNALFDCHRYCKTEGGWHFGFYTSNSTCQMINRHRLGWCCEGECHEKMACAGKKKPLS
ncbi:uncharacterized protein LOC125940204 [Dermacentor silvarum]|uniref:uncharacterized protein LOC125940204 n=1 Tax=Dermacentor silvarum TaxID=543639 RepID=UPI00210072BF|nr:uncharacterized protein LOC125940204 [Dermacentor silvarum]